MIQAAGEDGVDDLHHNRHDVNEAGRLGAQSLLVNDAVLLVYGRRVISFMKPAFFGWGFAGRVAMLLPSRVAGRTIGLRGPDLARGPEPAHDICTLAIQPTLTYEAHAIHLKKTDPQLLEKAHARISKTSLGLSKFSKTN